MNILKANTLVVVDKNGNIICDIEIGSFETINQQNLVIYEKV